MEIITEILGECPVDSGCLMVVDPTYVLDETIYQERVLNQFEKVGYKHAINPIFCDSAGYGVVIPTTCGDGVYYVEAEYELTESGSKLLRKIIIDFRKGKEGIR